MDCAWRQIFFGAAVDSVDFVGLEILDVGSFFGSFLGVSYFCLGCYLFGFGLFLLQAFQI